MFETEIETLNGLLTGVEFIGGFVAGLVVLVSFAVSPTLRANRILGYAGWTSVVLVVALYLDFGRRLGAFAGLIALGVAGWWIDKRPDHGGPAGAWVTAAAGGMVFAWRSGLEAPDWAVATIPLFLIAVGASLVRWRAIDLGRLIGPVIALGAIGVWATIPDTEMASVMLGCTLPLFAITPHPIEARITTSGALTLSAMVAWIIVQGGADRPSSVVGAMGVFAVIVIVAVLGTRSLSIRGGALTLIGVHLATVIVSSRLIGLSASVGSAVASMLVLVVASTVTIRVLAKQGEATNLGD